MKRIENVCVFLAGGALYGIIEMLCRGYTHWSMVIAGGIAFFLLHEVNVKMEARSLVARAAVGALLITAVELAAGLVFNVWLGMGVWDYSRMRWNLLGQVCPTFTVLWFLLCIPAFCLSRAVRNFFRVISENDERS